MKIDVIEKYKVLKKELEELRDDIKCTEKLINDPKVDWYTKHEYKNDLYEDKRMIMAKISEINILMDYMYQNKMLTEIEEINKLSEEEKKQKLI